MQEPEGKVTVSTQFNDRQLDLLLQILIAEKLKPSKAEVLRLAFEFYAKEKYPQLYQAPICESEV